MSERKAEVFVDGTYAGILEKLEDKKGYQFTYDHNYKGDPVSLTMPLKSAPYIYEKFPPFFDGLLPEGFQLEALLKEAKIDEEDYLLQLITVGKDLVGNVTVQESK